jgi:hypothetical protein
MKRAWVSLAILLTAKLPAALALEWWTDIGAQELTTNSMQSVPAGKVLSLLAPINGTASGQIAIRAGSAITNVQAKVTGLTGIVARIRYLSRETAAFNIVSETFEPSDSPLAVLYVTVDVPVGTAAGTFAGAIEVSSQAGAFTVPVTVNVPDFVMPGRTDLAMWISLAQSPAQLAFAYKTEPYGEAHWKAIEASTRLLGDMGHHVLFVPVLWHANCGSGPQMIVFRRDGDTLQPDFSRLERYFKLVARECGPQRLLVLGVWGRWLAPGGRTDKYPADTLHLTSDTLKPLAWSSDYHAHENLWRSVYDGVAKLAQQHLLVEQERIVLGFADDTHPGDEVDAFWRRIAPRSPGWDAWTHNYGFKGPRPSFFQIVDTAAPNDVKALLSWPPRSAPYVDDNGRPQPFYISATRDIQHSRSPAALYYSIPDATLIPQKTGHPVGFSRIGLDFWPKDIVTVDGTTVRGDGFAADGPDVRTHPERVMRNYRGTLTAQGEPGAMPLVHFDALREGVQAAQARITVVRAMQAKPELRDKFMPTLERQWKEGFRYAVIKQGNSALIREVSAAEIRAGWEPLFRAAAEAQRALGERDRDEASARAEMARRAVSERAPRPVSNP